MSGGIGGYGPPVPAVPCESGPDACPESAHAAFGYCTASDSTPVIVITQVPCVDGIAQDPIITLFSVIDGSEIPFEPLQPCPVEIPPIETTISDFEPIVLCDNNGPFLRGFLWDGATVTPTDTLLDGTTVYAPEGTIRVCGDDCCPEQEITPFCYTDGPDTLHGWRVWTFTAGVPAFTYYDADGVELVAPAAVACPDLATEATLTALLIAFNNEDFATEATLNALFGAFTLEDFATESTLLLIETELAAFHASFNAVDFATEATLQAIENAVDGVETLLANIDADTSAILLAVDGIEALLTTVAPDTATLANVAAAVASTQLFAANPDAKIRTIVNDSALARLYIKYGTAASATSYTEYLDPGESYEFPRGDTGIYVGVVHGIWTLASGSARVTEVTP